MPSGAVQRALASNICGYAAGLIATDTVGIRVNSAIRLWLQAGIKPKSNRIRPKNEVLSGSLWKVMEDTGGGSILGDSFSCSSSKFFAFFAPGERVPFAAIGFGSLWKPLEGVPGAGAISGFASHYR